MTQGVRGRGVPASMLPVQEQGSTPGRVSIQDQDPQSPAGRMASLQLLPLSIREASPWIRPHCLILTLTYPGLGILTRVDFLCDTSADIAAPSVILLISFSPSKHPKEIRPIGAQQTQGPALRGGGWGGEGSRAPDAGEPQILPSSATSTDATLSPS